MTTPAMRHQQRVRQQQAEARAKAHLDAKQADEIDNLAGDYEQHQLVVTSLEQDAQRLQGLTLEEKGEMKRDELLPRYRPVVDAYLAACEDGEEPYRNPVLVQVMIWLFDLGEIQPALDLAKVAHEQHQPMPERFNRSLETYVADALREWAENQQAEGDPIEPYFSDTFDRIRSEQWQVNPAALMKLHKLAGQECQKREALEDALAHYKTAVKLDPKRSKVKTVIARLEKQLASKAPADE